MQTKSTNKEDTWWQLSQEKLTFWSQATILNNEWLLLTYSGHEGHGSGRWELLPLLLSELKILTPTSLGISSVMNLTCCSEVSENVVAEFPSKFNHSTRCWVPVQGCWPKLQCGGGITLWTANSNRCYSISCGQLHFTWMHLVLTFLLYESWQTCKANAKYAVHQHSITWQKHVQLWVATWASTHNKEVT